MTTAKTIATAIIILLTVFSAIAVDLTPQGNINLKGRYNVTNASNFCIGDDCRSSWPAGSAGWTNTSAVTSTTLNVSVTGKLAISRTIAAPFELYQRAITNISVPYFTSAQNNTVAAFDIFPNGAPSDYGSEGLAWMDVCDTDIANANPGMNCARIGISSTKSEIGTRTFNGPSTTKPLYFTFNGSTMMTFNGFGTGTNITFGGSAPRSKYTFENGIASGTFLSLYDSSWTTGERKKLVETYAGTTKITSYDVVFDFAGGQTSQRWSVMNNSATILQDAMVLSGQGSLGIGTTAPTQKLDVNGSVNISGTTYLHGTRINGDTTNPYVILNNSLGAYLGYTQNNILVVNSNSIRGFVGGGTVWTTTSTGLGIGIATPTQKLDVNGSINVSGTSSFVSLPNNGRLQDNSTCTIIKSPSGGGQLAICN